MGISELRVIALDADKVIHRTLRISGFAAALLFSTALTAPAFAGGGASGHYAHWVARGGDDQLTDPGSPGEDGSGCCGGGGGGAGTTGGQGGTSLYDAGGAGGSTPGADGAAGSMDFWGFGSGGGGGAHGYVGATLPTSGVRGGAGGKGGLGDTSKINHDATEAGGGGAGGYGAVVTGSGLLGTLTTSVYGGSGGAGGDALNDAAAGSGGSGGVGLRFTSTANKQLIIGNSVSGGNGGATGANGGVNGLRTAGLGGVGLEGASMDVTMLAGGSIAGGMSGDSVTQANAINFTDGRNALRFTGPTSQLSGNINLGSNAALWLYGVPGLPGGTVIDNVITGGGTITKDGSGTITFSAANTYSGGTVINDGTLKLSGAGTLGNATSTTTVHSGTLDLGATTQTQSRVNLYSGMLQNGNLNASVFSNGGTIKDLGGTASLTTEDGTTTLQGINRYSGATVVNGGTLDVRGTITGTSSVGVYDGATLTGAGIIVAPSVTIYSGGTFKPGDGTAGSSTTVEGSLAFQSGAFYSVTIDPVTASFANVVTGLNSPGMVTIDSGATVNAVFANGSYISKTYTILTTTDGRSGTFDPTVKTTNLPANFRTTLGYDANNVYLNLALNYTPEPKPEPTNPTAPLFTPLNQNQRNVGNAVINAFNAGGAIPIAFGALTPAGLSQASGETSVGSQQTTFDAMNLFMGAMIDPFAAGRSDGVSPSARVSSYAEEHSPRNAYAMFTKAMPVKADPFAQRWNVWATGFGGSQTTDGNTATGSNTSTSRIYGAAVGADYRISPNTLAGFAMSGGGTTFSVANSGNGRSDLFQVGGFVRHTIGTSYLTAALSYAWQDVTTDRNVAGIDQLQARFNVNAFSGRFEGGTRYVTPWMEIGATPYAAVQATAFDLPGYREQVLSGPGIFALNYDAKGITSTRSELGVRTDKAYALTDSILTLRGRFAWAHEFNPDRSVAATFQSVPGASFVVNGARQASDAALTTASAEVKWRSGFSLAAIFEGEFSDVTRSYAGKGVARYQW
ncbi:Outer membrane autotransporter barrel [Rhodopseudomonas palustris BisB5]|uniref:Outer membrane autotransporter barrel n=1 Tax=Rhodopseudomonas palustris (strain BisB5) TaxID=316057 RepID=Q137J7_RHOPS|nr:Outer membrane autotransporter barrel [Rhodopseudomonas palustris BisB5]